MVGACVVSTTASSSVRARTSGPASRTPKCTRSTKPAHAARGATMYCTLEPCCAHRPHRAVHRAHHRCRHRRVVAAMEDPISAGQGPRLRDAAATRHSTWTSASSATAAVRLNQPFLTVVRDGTSVRDHESGGEPATAASRRRRGDARSSPRAAAHPARAVRSRAGGRGGRRVGNGARGRSAADGPRGLSRAAAGAGRLRSPAAHAASRAPALDARCRAGDHHDDRDAIGGSGTRDALERAGARSSCAEADGVAGGVCAALPGRTVQSLVLEGGPPLHAAAWDEGVVDYVQLYVAPSGARRRGVPLLPARHFSTSALIEAGSSRSGRIS